MSSRFLRRTLLASVVAGALAPAGTAAAAYAPKLSVTPIDAAPAAGGTPASGAAVSIDLRAGAADDATARFVVYLPLGYRTGRPAPGEQAGTASGTAVTASGQAVSLGGNVVGATADDAAAACAPAGSAVWLLQLARAGTLIRVPLVVADAPPGAATIASATLTGCLPAASSTEAGGLRILSATFTLGANALTQPKAAGTYRWRAQLTPFAAGSPGENAAGTVEAQAIVPLHASLTAAARLVVQRTPVDVKVTRTIGGKAVTAVERKVRVTRLADVRGTAPAGADPGSDVRVTVLGGTTASALRRLVQLSPAADGAWATRIQIDSAASTVYFQAKLVLPARDLGAGACTPSFGASVPCVSATEPALRLASPVVALTTGR